MCLFLLLPDNKSTTTLSNNKSMISVSKNPNNQLAKKIDNLIIFLK